MATALEGTRLKILAVIQKQGSASVDRIAQEIGLSPVSIRRHLDILQRDHLVSFDQGRKKVGRPEFVYFLTEEGHESGFRDYQKLLALLLAEVASLAPADLVGKDGQELLRVLIGRVSDQVSSSYVDPGQSSQEARLDRMEQALTDRGFSPEITQEGGQVRIRLRNCPFRAAALGQKSVCQFDQKLIANILGVEPVCQSTIHDGDTSCCYVATLGSS